MRSDGHFEMVVDHQLFGFSVVLADWDPVLVIDFAFASWACDDCCTGQVVKVESVLIAILHESTELIVLRETDCFCARCAPDFFSA